MQEMVIMCPYCGLVSEIEQINCGVFRCGYYCNSLLQIPPHLSEEEGNRLVKEKKIYGCSRPFKIVDGLVMGCGYE